MKELKKVSNMLGTMLTKVSIFFLLVFLNILFFTFIFLLVKEELQEFMEEADAVKPILINSY